MIDTIAAIVADFRAVGDTRPMDKVTLGLVLLAIGDSLVGEEVAQGVGQPRSEIRDLAVRQIGAMVAPPSPLSSARRRGGPEPGSACFAPLKPNDSDL